MRGGTMPSAAARRRGHASRGALQRQSQRYFVQHTGLLVLQRSQARMSDGCRNTCMRAGMFYLTHSWSPTTFQQL